MHGALLLNAQYSYQSGPVFLLNCCKKKTACPLASSQSTTSLLGKKGKPSHASLEDDRRKHAHITDFSYDEAREGSVNLDVDPNGIGRAAILNIRFLYLSQELIGPSIRVPRGSSKQQNHIGHEKFIIAPSPLASTRSWHSYDILPSSGDSWHDLTVWQQTARHC